MLTKITLKLVNSLIPERFSKFVNEEIIKSNNKINERKEASFQFCLKWRRYSKKQI